MARPARVLELRSVYGTGGGPDKTILMGAARATPERVSVTVCYVRDARDPVFGIGARAATAGLDYVELVERHSFDLGVWRQLLALIRTRRIDIVHAHDYKTDLLALMLARRGGALPLATAHGWTGHSWRERCLYYPADRRLLAAFPCTIAVSHQIRSVLVAAGARPERLRVILNGIDPVAFTRDRTREAEARRTLGVVPGDVVIGAAGRLERQKRFDLLLRACARVKARHPRLRLLIAGDGSLRASLGRLGEQLLGEAFALLGHQADIRVLHHACDLFVQSSDYEGTPNAVLEAMALETPLVATDAGGTAEIVRHGDDGLIVPTGHVQALADAIERGITEPAAAAARAARARRRVETVFSFAARTAALEQVYEELMGRRGGA